MKHYLTVLTILILASCSKSVERPNEVINTPPPVNISITPEQTTTQVLAKEGNPEGSVLDSFSIAGKVYGTGKINGQRFDIPSGLTTTIIVYLWNHPENYNTEVDLQLAGGVYRQSYLSLPNIEGGRKDSVIFTRILTDSLHTIYITKG